ncbi:hypothetical protein [Flavobacterium sandaracinum]|uniref:Uncharacterized protein n=1 Tax=Flavobacterium sandaracinum TaxID=2541733 RepID=A0A4R5CUG5_9FLAO|nr:hypothetical protein [Flavobacterium sandaracinum]TDE04322.1 hypothetical protein E0F91_08375 [Flavobacterium sandaracinum]
MKLTSSQIDHLFTFTRQNSVEWYDLQSELVDHIANAIETQWQENPNRSFDEALQLEFKKFGVFGFMDVVEKKTKALNKTYYKHIWHHLKDFFTIPRILVTVILTTLLFCVVKYSENFKPLIIGVLVVLVGFVFYKMIKMNQARKKKTKSGQKIWLFEETIFRLGGLGGLISLPLNIIIQSQYQSFDYNFDNFILFVLSFIFVLIGIVYYIVLCIIPSKATQYLEATYPEYKLENETRFYTN